MTTQSTHTTPTATCPSWCVNHIASDDVHGGVPWGGDPLHSSADVKGETTEGEWLGRDRAKRRRTGHSRRLRAPGQMTPEQGRALSSAIIQACETIEGTPVTAA